MLAYLEGQTLYKDKESWIIKAGSVGYRVQVPSSLDTTWHLGQDVTLWIEPIVHEGAFTFFGFGSLEDLCWFRWLIAVPGVGGRVAIQILGRFDPLQLSEAILSEQAGWLRQVDGVGPKLATRLVAELTPRAHQWQKEQWQKEWGQAEQWQNEPQKSTHQQKQQPPEQPHQEQWQNKHINQAPQPPGQQGQSEPNQQTPPPCAPGTALAHTGSLAIPEPHTSGPGPSGAKSGRRAKPVNPPKTSSYPAAPGRASLSARTEAVLALEALGYSYRQAHQAVLQAVTSLADPQPPESGKTSDSSDHAPSTAQIVQASLALLSELRPPDFH